MFRKHKGMHFVEKCQIPTSQTLTSFSAQHMAHLLCWGLGEPLRAVIKALTSLVEAASSSDVTDRQTVGAAMDVVLAASGLRQRAASKGEAVAEVLTQAAAGASCKSDII